MHRHLTDAGPSGLGRPLDFRGHRERQADREPRALPDLTVACDRPSVLLHDAVGDGQSESRSLADLLRREERVVNPRQLLGRNARPGVGDLRRSRRPARRASRSSATRPSASRRARSGTGSGTPAAACARSPAPPAARAASSLRTWMLPVLNWCSSSDSTSLTTALMSHGPLSTCAGRARFSSPLTIFAARNVCRSIFSSTCVDGSSGSRRFQQHLREARDAGQRRVHLVRDAGREQPDRRHLLRDLQLLLELHARRDVLDDDDAADDVRRASRGAASAPRLTSRRRGGSCRVDIGIR